MSPFKKCILSSQEVLYRSLYLNPLSDSPEHPHRPVIPLLRQDSSSSPHAPPQLPPPPPSSSSSISTSLSWTLASLPSSSSSSRSAYHHRTSSFPTHMKSSSDHINENGNYAHQQFKENDPPRPVLLKQNNAGKPREQASTASINTVTASAAGPGGVNGKTSNSSSSSREPLRPVAEPSPSSKKSAPLLKSSGALTDLQVAALLPRGTTGRGEEIVKEEGLGQEEDEAEEAALVPASAAIAAAAAVAEGCYFQGTTPLLLPPPTPSHLSHVWDDPASELAAPASAWSTIGNRTLLCRPLPLDVGRCVCYISRERQDGCSVYSLYTDEGYGRQDRKLAVARHRRKAGRSEFLVYPSNYNACRNNNVNPGKSHVNGKSANAYNGPEKGPSAAGSSSEDAIIGRMQANLLGSRYCVWDEVDTSTGKKSKGRRQLLGVVMFEPTITTLTGTFRVMKVSIPKYQSMQITSSTQHEKNGLAPNWEEKIANVYQLCSRKPYYNKASRRYELDFRDRAKRSSRIKTSAKNLQLTMDENGKQAILMLGKVGKSKYVMEYRFPLTGYQAFSICLASLDSKLCCSI